MQKLPFQMQRDVRFDHNLQKRNVGCAIVKGAARAIGFKEIQEGNVRFLGYRDIINIIFELKFENRSLAIAMLKTDEHIVFKWNHADSKDEIIFHRQGVGANFYVFIGI